VSIIVPTFNRAEILPRTLDSALTQSGDYSLEVIVIDDGSSDATAAVVRQIAARDHRVRYFFQENGGPSRARNTGLKLARGKFVQFLDDDDVLHPEKIKRQLSVLAQRPDADVCYCQVRLLNPGDRSVGPFVGRCNQHHPDLAAAFLSGFPFPAHSPLYRRTVFLESGNWREELELYEDWEFNFRVGLVARHPVWVPQTLAFYNRHSGARLSRISEAKAVVGWKAYLDALTQDVMSLAPHRIDLLKVLWRLHVVAAVRHVRIGLAQAGRNCLHAAARLSPTRPRRALVVLLILLLTPWGGRPIVKAYDSLMGVIRRFRQALRNVEKCASYTS